MPKKKSIYDNSHITANSKQLDLLKQHFPNCFDKEGNFISHKMEEIVGNAGLELSRESYSLNWLGKSYARLLANENPCTLLREDKVHNAKEENRNSENLLIKGDNLEVLKHLVNAYSEQIKMIYIDPPYNTGGDGFVYSDDRKFTVEELQKLAGVERDEAKRILEFTSSKSNSHSAWLTFMYPRLYVARELLREDGVIFISIDDNEVAQLKLLCDEVFGEENFVANFIWKKRTGSNDAKNLVSSDHEYILCYSKDEETTLKGIEKKFENYKNPDNDPLGDWMADNLTCNKTATERPNLYYPITDPKTGIIYECNKNRVWAYEKKRMEKNIQENKIIFPKKANGSPMYKRHKNEVKSRLKPISTLLGDFLNATATKELRILLDGQHFDYPKSLKLLNILIQQSTSTNDLILDFFAGSGTTAHAVMALNAEDGGNRKFITVQIPEKTDNKSEAYKAGYKTIFDITKARIEKATEKLNDKQGFKIFETTPIFEGYLDDLEELNEKTTLFNGSELSTDELETLLTTWKVHDGMKLHEPLVAIDLGGYVAYGSSDIIYFMEKSFNIKTLQAFITKLDEDETFEPSKLVLFGYNFDSKHQREFKEALKNYSNKKSIELDMVVRY
ncbi:Type III restriction-modification system methylation subunit [hydrothermal vent metagenome]|uniref:Type III restriction-modification system methylation subunit n=1 Tax=hydrothermal vent metagenome TaxID=652676 RepID=A0A1W1BZE1_9ZZZZ